MDQTNVDTKIEQNKLKALKRFQKFTAVLIKEYNFTPIGIVTRQTLNGPIHELGQVLLVPSSEEEISQAETLLKEETESKKKMNLQTNGLGANIK